MIINFMEKIELIFQKWIFNKTQAKQVIKQKIFNWFWDKL